MGCQQDPRHPRFWRPAQSQTRFHNRDCAIALKPLRIGTRIGVCGQVLHALLPRVAQIVLNTSLHMFPDSDTAQGGGKKAPQMGSEQIAMQQQLRGVHF
ncbi:hypothetical protein ACFOLJ_30590 [Rugamonas sp. CCM 8940]|uniref:hypothetical protein n=1 Tax=Rugamonas sp. CCM 8940 TaxID=2765359 RepID=UPI001F2F642D|nr:hypothetical protein [Rugamonas sp. CCM 8940]